MSSTPHADDLAIDVLGQGANNLRKQLNGTVEGKIPGHVVLTTLPGPACWASEGNRVVGHH